MYSLIRTLSTRSIRKPSSYVVNAPNMQIHYTCSFEASLQRDSQHSPQAQFVSPILWFVHTYVHTYSPVFKQYILSWNIFFFSGINLDKQPKSAWNKGIVEDKASRSMNKNERECHYYATKFKDVDIYTQLQKCLPSTTETHTECVGENISVNFFWLRRHLEVTTINAGKDMDSIVNSTIYCEVGF